MKVIDVVKGAWGVGKKEAVEMLKDSGRPDYAQKTVKMAGVCRNGRMAIQVWELVGEGVYFADEGPGPVFTTAPPRGMLKR